MDPAALLSNLHASGSSSDKDSDSSMENINYCFNNSETNLTKNQGYKNSRIMTDRENFDNFCLKEPKQENNPLGFYMPPLFLTPLSMIRPSEQEQEAVNINRDGGSDNNIKDERRNSENQLVVPVVRGCRQFWKAGDYEESNGVDYTSQSVSMDHVRVHPKFLHSNATSHKWSLGAFAELLDNGLDEVVHGATFVNVDVLHDEKHGSPMILVEDNGGGMTPDKMRQCMSLGYSAKSKMANTIGQYGNGFKTSTMRLGADVIVFSHSKGKDGISETRSIGLLSYSYLRATGKEDIVVPMIDFEKRDEGWEKIINSNLNEWEMKLMTILQWSPFLTEDSLMLQLDSLRDQGTRIIIYNLWEDEENKLELDFDADPHDIQLRGVNRDEKNIQMAEQYQYCTHFLTYKHSLRSYASILYLELPAGFRIILRGKDVQHHNLLDDMMMPKEIIYRPQHLRNKEGLDKDCAARGILGFVKDAHHHIDIQGFNVYHKNRLIKPFWRVWNAAGSDGRGVIGLLEANFVEPAHDKQGFERTFVLSRLEDRLIELQKSYWASNCHEIGYAARRNPKKRKNAPSKTENVSPAGEELFSSSAQNEQANNTRAKRTHKDSSMNGNVRDATADIRMTSPPKVGISTPANDEHKLFQLSGKQINASATNQRSQGVTIAHPKIIKEGQFTNGGYVEDLRSFKDASMDRAKRIETEEEKINSLLKELELEREKSQKLETQLLEKAKELDKSKTLADQLDKDHITIIDILQDERQRWFQTESLLMEKLRTASETIEELRERVKQLESGMAIKSCKPEKN